MTDPRADTAGPGDSSPLLSPTFDYALVYAHRLHGHAIRKGTSIPYVSHLLAVAALVLEAGGDEETAIAALLHDAVEDGGGRPRLEDIRARFGERVARIVEECSDSFTEPKPPWPERRRAYLARLPAAPREALVVSAADKLHNARAILADYRAQGEGLWQRFNAPREDILWYYRELVAIFRDRGPASLAGELARVVAEIHHLAGVASPGPEFGAPVPSA